MTNLFIWCPTACLHLHKVRHSRSSASLPKVTLTWETVVEVNSSISSFTLSSLNNTSAFNIHQHFHVQAGSSEIQGNESERQGLCPSLSPRGWLLGKITTTTSEYRGDAKVPHSQLWGRDPEGGRQAFSWFSKTSRYQTWCHRIMLAHIQLK